MNEPQEQMEALLEKLRGDSEFKAADPCYVSIYCRERCYGGPEEGGWWYDRISLEGSLYFPTRSAAELYLKEAEKAVKASNEAEAPQRARAMANIPEGPDPYYDTEGYIPLGWGDGGESEVVIEKISGSREMNQCRPHYE